MRTLKTIIAASLLVAVITTASASAQPLNLSSWTVEAEPGISIAETASWLISADRLSATQLNNPVQTVLYSDFEVDRALIRAELRVDALASPLANDDDWIAFAIGFDPGETQDSDALSGDRLEENHPIETSRRRAFRRGCWPDSLAGLRPAKPCRALRTQSAGATSRERYAQSKADRSVGFPGSVMIP